MTLEHVPPTLSDDLRRMTSTELSLPRRLGYVALLLAAAAMAGITGALWLTEPALPARTSLALAVMVLIGLSWTAFATWVLTHKRMLLARHRVVAGRMSVTFCAAFLLAALFAAYATGQASAYAAVAVAVLMLAIATLMLRRAHRAVARLTERREALARELARGR